MTRTALPAPLSAAPATAAEVPSRRAAGPWRRIAASLHHVLRRLDSSLALDEDGRYLAAARSLEDLESRQRRLERYGSPVPPAWLP